MVEYKLLLNNKSLNIFPNSCVLLFTSVFRILAFSHWQLQSDEDCQCEKYNTNDSHTIKAICLKFQQ